MVFVFLSVKISLTQTSVLSVTQLQSNLSLPPGKQEVAEMCFLLECETASLAAAPAVAGLDRKAPGRNKVSLLYVHGTLQPPVFNFYFSHNFYYEVRMACNSLFSPFDFHLDHYPAMMFHTVELRDHREG